MNKMRREKIKKYHQPGEHIWEPMKEYQLDEEDNTDVGLEYGIETEIKKLRKMKPNIYLVAITLPAKETNTQPFLDYIKKIRDYGLDIDKSESAEYGYKMPPAEKDKPFRELKIFRREIIRKEKIFRRK